jgi:hypothetical protein
MEVGGVSLSFGCFFFSLSLSTFVERESRVRCERESLLISEERERGSQPSRRMEGERRVRRRGVGGWGQARRGAHRHRLAGGAEPAGGGDVSVGRRCAAGGRAGGSAHKVRVCVSRGKATAAADAGAAGQVERWPSQQPSGGRARQRLGRLGFQRVFCPSRARISGGFGRFSRCPPRASLFEPSCLLATWRWRERHHGFRCEPMGVWPYDYGHDATSRGWIAIWHSGHHENLG